jgi:hypothetical protein
MKDAKFPGVLDLTRGAIDAEAPVRLLLPQPAMPRTDGAAPDFLVMRRRLMKTHQSMKHKCVSAFSRVY